MDQTVVVLLHGAGMEAWVWDRVRPLVQVTTLAPDLPSRAAQATPADCAARLLSSIDAHPESSIVLVMHSLAGVLAADLARLLRGRLKACVYVSAVVPGEGSTFAKAVGFPGRLLLPLLFRLNPNGLKPSERMIRDELCGDLDAEDAERVVQRYQPEFSGLYLSKVGAPPRCRSVYVRLANDKSVSPAQQSQMLARLNNPEIHEIQSGHLVMLSRPAELAAVINRVATS